MSEYGIQPTGFVRKPASVILAEIEADMITEFGPGVIQTPQSPFGQINGLMTDLISEIWEMGLDIYQSHDPSQAEGVRLEMLGRIRNVNRNGRSDEEFRQAVTNAGETRFDFQDLSAAIAGIEGVSFVKVSTNDEGALTLSVIGGDDEEVALMYRWFVAPGVDTFGNVRVKTFIEGFCRSISIVRPVAAPVELTIYLKDGESEECLRPSDFTIRAYFAEKWAENNSNGKDVNFYTVRKIIESGFSNLQVSSIKAVRPDSNESEQANDEVLIDFFEISQIDVSNVTVF